MKKELKVKWRRAEYALSRKKKKKKKISKTETQETDEGTNASLMQMTLCPETAWARLETYHFFLFSPCRTMSWPTWPRGHEHKTHTPAQQLTRHPLIKRNSVTQCFHALVDPHLLAPAAIAATTALHTSFTGPTLPRGRLETATHKPESF